MKDLSSVLFVGLFAAMILCWADSLLGDGVAQELQLFLKKLAFFHLQLQAVLLESLEYLSQVFFVFFPSASSVIDVVDCALAFSQYD